MEITDILFMAATIVCAMGSAVYILMESLASNEIQTWRKQDELDMKIQDAILILQKIEQRLREKGF